MNRRRFQNLIRPWAGGLLAVSMMMSSGAQALMPVLAQSETASSGGSIVLKPGDAGSLVGRKFAIYTVFHATPSKDGTSINYTFAPECENALRKVIARRMGKAPAGLIEYEAIDYLHTLKTQGEGVPETDTSAFRIFVEELRDELKASKVPAKEVKIDQTDADGSVTITDLPYGWYLVDELNTTAGMHKAASLCLVDTQTGQIELTLKGDYPEVTKKIFEDDLDVGWNDLADFQIGQTIPYKFESQVPGIDAYERYYFAFHDRMDPAITFEKESVKVSLSDGTKTYPLQTEEFRIVEGQKDETFRIEIEDLKAIVDREYGTGNYGQQVLVEYNGRLSDLAAAKTGRPGFENTVWLEFSNDPDSDGNHSTGKTPEDTLVCFTYRIHGNKVNDAKKGLEGAVFRLYADKEGTSEILVRKTESGYIVMDNDALAKDPSLKNQAAEIVSDDQGRFEIIGLDQGTYYLQETLAPDGYRRLNDPIELTVLPTFAQERNQYISGQGATPMILKELQADVKISEFLNGALTTSTEVLNTDPEEGRMDLEVVNHTGLKLPLTGSNTLLVTLCAGSILVVGGVWLKGRRKK